MKIIDMIGVGLIIVGIIMTAMSFFSRSGPSSEIVDSEIHEITPAPPINRQPISDRKPQIKLSEARAIVRHFVEDVDADSRTNGLKEMTEKEKSEMVESIITNMKKQGSYDFVDE